jgi:serine/threonine-protein kinase
VRFVREARVMESLGDMSRHITRVLEYGVLSDGVPYLIMERLNGEGLDVLLKREKVLPLPRIVDIVGQLCKALAVTHAEGIIHRDIKPPNVFLCPDVADPTKTFVKLLDFGVVKVLAEAGETTLQGQLIGTPNYMSPEQLTPKASIDHRADVFAVGAIIYRCATGRVAFGKGTPQEMIQRVLHEMPPPATSINPALPAEFDPFLQRCLAKRPEERFQSVRELADTLRLLVEDPAAAWVYMSPPADSTTARPSVSPPTAPTRSPLPWVLLAVLVLGGLLAVALRVR